MKVVLIQSESIKLRRSSVVKIAWIGLCMGLISGTLFMISKQSKQSWEGINAWHTLWTTFLYPIVIALMAGLTAKREKSARGGGTWWRPYSLRELRAAEYFWLVIIIAVTTAFVLLASIPFGIIAALPGPVPLLQLLKLCFFLTVSGLAIMAIQQKLAYAAGLIASLLLSLAGTISGVVMAEHRLWWMNPWSWPIRSSLVFTGTHANGIPMEPNDPGWTISPWLTVVPSVLMAVVMLSLPYFTLQKRKQRARTKPEKKDVVYKSNFTITGYIAAELVKTKKTILYWLCFGIPLLFGAIALWRSAPMNILQLWSILVLPFGAALLSALVWMPESGAWRILCTRPVSISKLYLTKLMVVWGLANAGTLIFLLFLLSSKVSLVILGSFYLIYCALSFALLAFNLWMAVRFNVGMTLGAGAVFTLLALIIGGTGLGQGIWPFFPWTWGWMAVKEGTVWYSFLSILIGVIFSWAGVYYVKSTFINNDQ
ncbi:MULTISPECIES: ABC transporter permease [Chryseobacterium]|uniref:ABC transporter permease n=1 Tax=Chryseobacterium camelliae TaxID=1265445 RepID=A0ABU0TEG2_9FLAO|nr:MULTISPECIES: ABC transporter permease [Chryseobacterium]MDT3406749.1 hypothetical protein [Pseudacidovorax intermedius]MDQ1095454.1 hypothetical protein [Chryseobacterium camelliae]MDQ1099394.1 hypothetical protein [Chryseobacterium sp. SORGH_AS_1048]MDR6086740.1 hypothetical protein [Chryseobacterium sp. SORGH_AS_0909]MDR6131112.1 hypothetical protein [Chryseobacterium sp. SORGH_AS_1175]